MGRALRFTKHEIANAAAICQEHKVILKLSRDGSMLVFPDSHKTPRLDTTEAEDLDAELAAFEARHGDD